MNVRGRFCLFVLWELSAGGGRKVLGLQQSDWQAKRGELASLEFMEQNGLQGIANSGLLQWPGSIFPGASRTSWLLHKQRWLRNAQNAGRDLSLNLQGSQKPTSLQEAMIQCRLSKASVIVGLVSVDFYGAWNWTQGSVHARQALPLSCVSLQSVSCPTTSIPE